MKHPCVLCIVRQHIVWYRPPHRVPRQHKAPWQWRAPERVHWARCVCLSDRGHGTFCAAVLSSARHVARFLAHWPSCMAAAWSVTVGTEDFEEVTILLPGFRVESGRVEDGKDYTQLGDIAQCILFWQFYKKNGPASGCLNTILTMQIPFKKHCLNKQCTFGLPHGAASNDYTNISYLHYKVFHDWSSSLKSLTQTHNKVLEVMSCA